MKENIMKKKKKRKVEMKMQSEKKHEGTEEKGDAEGKSKDEYAVICVTMRLSASLREARAGDNHITGRNDDGDNH